MYIIIDDFIDYLNVQEKLSAETSAELPVLQHHLSLTLQHFRNDPPAAHILLGQQILTHTYGSDLAILLRRYIEEVIVTCTQCREMTFREEALLDGDDCFCSERCHGAWLAGVPVNQDPEVAAEEAEAREWAA